MSRFAPLDYTPPYLALHRSGELARRAELALSELADCVVCPRDCHVDRLAGREASCRTGRLARVSSCFAHFGEEDCLRGWRGSGTIFFGMCNLRCVFCQNHEISQKKEAPETSPEALASMMLHLQDVGCHNINFVTPEHVVPQLLEALVIAVERGLRLPLVYNTSAYDSLRSLELLDGVVDIYMPDFKLFTPELAARYLKARDYPEVARRAIAEMQRQVGDLAFDSRGLAQRGVLVRHLVMPGLLDETEAIVRWLVEQVSPRIYVNVMSQYHPTNRVSEEKYDEINRTLGVREFDEAIARAGRAGLERFDERDPLRHALNRQYWD